MKRTLVAATALAVFPASALAQQVEDASIAVRAVADAALAAISAEDFVALTDLMVDEARTYSIGLREGELAYRTQTRAEQRAAEVPIDIIERGFDPKILVDGRIAMVWYPYDIYLDGAWSHCGVDLFAMLLTEEGWRITSMSWTVEQPPACKPHPDGPPQ